MIGNSPEWYDFTVYAFVVSTIDKRFFPRSTETVTLLATLAVFGVGFAARPLDGPAIGMFGDAKDRKPILLLTISLR